MARPKPIRGPCGECRNALSTGSGDSRHGRILEASIASSACRRESGVCTRSAFIASWSLLCSQCPAAAGDRRTAGVSGSVVAAEWQPALPSAGRAGARRSAVVGTAHVTSQTSPAAGLAAKRSSRKKTGTLPRPMRLPTITRNAGETFLIHMESQPCHGGRVKGVAWAGQPEHVLPDFRQAAISGPPRRAGSPDGLPP
jgi:hypothetical protein